MKYIIAILILLTPIYAHALEVDLDKIATIESSNNPKAYNPITEAYGLYQITAPCLTDFNTAHQYESYTLNDMFDPIKSRKVAEWYMNYKIPKYLKHYEIEDTIENRLRAYNSGIGTVVKGKLPDETKNYIKKYKEAK